MRVRSFRSGCSSLEMIAVDDDDDERTNGERRRKVGRRVALHLTCGGR